MSEKVRRLIGAGLTLVLASIVLWGLVTGEPSNSDRVSSLGSRIKCPVCQGESILDSPSGYAQDMLAFVEEKVEEGWSDDEIVTYLEERFAGIRLDPAFSGTTLLLWLLPAVGLVGGALFVVSRLKRTADAQ